MNGWVCGNPSSFFSYELEDSSVKRKMGNTAILLVVQMANELSSLEEIKLEEL